MNYGLNLKKEKADIKPEDWVFGVGEKLTGIAEAVELINHLPAGEVQKSDKADMMDCTVRGPNNIIETKLNYWIDSKQIGADNLKWLSDVGFLNDKGLPELSDAYTAIKAGNTPQGNSLIAPVDAIRKYSFIPKKLMPLEKWMTWEQYHDPARITPEIEEIAKESKRRFPINYERVYEKDFPEVRKYDMIDVAGYAWLPPINGVYPNPGDRRFNHVWADIGGKTPQYTIFDNYIDSTDGDFIKRLVPDYNLLNYGYRIIINENVFSTMTELTRKKGKPEVFLSIGGKRYWIKDLEDFDALKKGQPIADISWKNVREVDSFTTPFDGRVIGKANFSDVLKRLFGKIR